MNLITDNNQELKTSIKAFKYKLEDLIQSYLADSNDLYIVSFPKSGVTWLRFLLAQFLSKTYDLPVDQPTVRLTALSSQCPNLPNIINTHEDSAILYENGTRPDAERMFIYGGRLRYRKNKVILLVRDPRDVVVSHYHQVTKRSKQTLKFNSMSEFIQHPIYGFDRILRYYQIWVRNQQVPKSILIVRYEDMMTKGIETLKEIIYFIGLDLLDEKLLAEVYEQSRAENMRKLEMKNRVAGMRVFGTNQNALKVRRCQIGSYQDEMSPEDIQYCNEKIASLPNIYGYSPSGIAFDLEKLEVQS